MKDFSNTPDGGEEERAACVSLLELRPQRLWIPAVMAIISLFQSGCTVVDSGRNMMHESFRIFKPRASDYRDHTQEESDEWESVGQEARGNRPLEDENDPLKQWFMSPKAKSIERNLGYE